MLLIDLINVLTIKRDLLIQLGFLPFKINLKEALLLQFKA